jgi:calcineurin-like phosphoesterase
LIKEYSPDFVIVNIDNLSSGRWPIEKHILELEQAWVDIMTSWDHIFDNFDKIEEYLWKKDSKLLRFANFYWNDIPWTGAKIFSKNGKKLLVIHLQWEVFMQHKVNNPFLVTEEILKVHKKDKLDWIVIDFHKEATSEIYWLVNYLDWQVSFIYWTHTHIQTNDNIIFPKWTGMITDVWMTWPLYSVIWADFESVKHRFLDGINKWKISQALGKEYIISWIFVKIWKKGECEIVEKIRLVKS